VIKPDPLYLRLDLTDGEQPIGILDCREKQFNKGRWDHTTIEATWEPEEEMQSKYPEILVPTP